MNDQVLLTLEQAAELLAYSPRTLQQLTAEGKVACVREGRLVRYRRVALEAYAEQAEGYDLAQEGNHVKARRRDGIHPSAQRRTVGGRRPGRLRDADRPDQEVPLRLVPG